MSAWGRLLPPRRVEGIDIVKLPLAPVEAFVLSQLDAAADLAELAHLTSLTEHEVERVLGRLMDIGAIESKGAKQDVRAPHAARPLRSRDPRREEDDDSVPREEQVGPTRAAQPPPPAPRAKSSRPPPPVAPESKPAGEEIEIDRERRENIDRVFDALDSLTHYQLLEVRADASKKDIKEAYYVLIAVFHPDRYFGKKLGSYKRRLERVFERMTQAYNVLTRDKTRAEYDMYLQERQRTRSYEAVMSSIPPPPPPTAAATMPAPAVPQPSTPEQSPHAMKRLARRLGAPLAAKSPEAPPARAGISPRVAEDLKRMIQVRDAQRSSEVEKFAKAGSEALESKHYVSAVNALRIALSLAPDDMELRALYENAEQLAAADLAESYEARAQYEERNQQWQDAARSYELVARGRPQSALPLERAAECLLQAGAEPRRAVELARRAVMISPNVAAYRATLAKAYEAAGFLNSALGEVRRALEIKPGDPELTRWATRLSRAER